MVWVPFPRRLLLGFGCLDSSSLESLSWESVVGRRGSTGLCFSTKEISSVTQTFRHSSTSSCKRFVALPPLPAIVPYN
jgi:hypothetical protein